jgi:hypothetical protein
LFLSLFIPLVVTKFEGSSVPIQCTYDLNMCDMQLVLEVTDEWITHKGCWPI